MLGFMLAQSGRIEEAMQSYLFLTCTDSYRGVAQFRLAQAYYERRNLDAALYWIRQAGRVRPGYTPFLAFCGQILKEAGEIEQARAVLRQALDADPENRHDLADKIMKALAEFPLAVSS